MTLEPDTINTLAKLDYAGEAIEVNEPECECEGCDCCDGFPDGKLLGELYPEDREHLRTLAAEGFAKDVSADYQVVDEVVWEITEAGRKRYTEVADEGHAPNWRRPWT